MKNRFIILILTVGLISACGSQPGDAPASQPTEKPVAATEVSASTDTTVPPTEALADQPAASSSVSFANDILPILQSRCLNCHGGERVEEGLSVKSYAELMAGSNNGPVVAAGDPGNSVLVELITNKKMPKKGPKLTPPQIQLITDWVNQGALDN